MAISNLVTSPHCICLVNSIPLARVGGLTYEVSSPKKELRGIDTLIPVELVPMGLSLRGTLQLYRLHQDGGAEAAGLVSTWNKATRQKYFSLMVIDRLTDTVLLQANRCDVIGQSWSIVPRQFVLGTISWQGLDYENDSL
jgi:hypothetical protein